MEHKRIQTIGKIFFMAAAVLMYYFLTEEIRVGVFITYRHAFALLLFAASFIAFLYKPNVARIIVSCKATIVYCLPLAVIFLSSLFIWFANQVDTDVISRGLSSLFIYTCMLSSTLAAAAFL